MRLGIELEREADGRWLAEVVDLPGVLVYGSTREEALAAAQALALRVLADQFEHAEAPGSLLSDLSFVVNAA
jgi:predicted RNase H-like HicB family nuclease